jgi:hypothetical protein
LTKLLSLYYASLNKIRLALFFAVPLRASATTAVLPHDFALWSLGGLSRRLF